MFDSRGRIHKYFEVFYHRKLQFILFNFFGFLFLPSSLALVLLFVLFGVSPVICFLFQLNVLASLLLDQKVFGLPGDRTILKQELEIRKLYLKLCQTADVSDASKMILLDGGNVWS